MKFARTTLLPALMMIILTSASFVPIAVAAENKPSLSKNELKVLLKTAKGSAEHRKIAEYYRQEAQRLIARSKYHQEMGAIYEKSPLPYEGKFPYGTVGLSHCRVWAELDAKQAKEAEALAGLHEDMAKAAEQKQP